MKPLLVLIVTFIVVAAERQVLGGFYVPFAGEGSNVRDAHFHSNRDFVFVQGMTMMIPAFVPFKRKWFI
jgi:hypothetical protein